MVSTMGISIVIGYCPMKSSYTISLSGKDVGCCCGKADGGGCCKSHKLTIKKIEDNYTTSAFNLTVPPLDHITFELPNLSLVWMNPHLQVIPSYKDHQPPEPPVLLHLLHRALLV